MAFPKDKLARMKTIVVVTNDGNSVEINYQSLNKVVIGNQLCFHYESKDGDLYLPIIRINTIQGLQESFNEVK